MSERKIPRRDVLKGALIGVAAVPVTAILGRAEPPRARSIRTSRKRRVRLRQGRDQGRRQGQPNFKPGQHCANCLQVAKGKEQARRCRATSSPAAWSKPTAGARSGQAPVTGRSAQADGRATGQLVAPLSSGAHAFHCDAPRIATGPRMHLRRYSRRSCASPSTCAGVEPRDRSSVGITERRGVAADAQPDPRAAEHARSRLDELAHDTEFVERVRRLDRHEAEYLSRPGWFRQAYEIEPPPLTPTSAWSTASPTPCPSIRAASACSRAITSRPRATSRAARRGGLVPIARVISARCSMRRAASSRSTRSMRASRCRSSSSTDAEGMPLRVTIELPGRDLRVRLWRADVGRAQLYLLDSNDPLNSPVRPRHHGEAVRRRWRGTADAGDRARRRGLARPRRARARRRGVPPQRGTRRARHHRACPQLRRAQRLRLLHALWATRAGNVFTTHTPVATAFDTFRRP